MESKISQINQLLCEKAYTKQKVYQITLDTMVEMKQVMLELQEEIMPCIHEDAPNVEVKFQDIGTFEAHMKFSGDTIVAMMHTNIFDFDSEHHVPNLPYIKEDPLREYCGMIQVYNFLSDSLRYERHQDMGYMLARIFINKDKHFFMEGNRPLSFTYGDISKSVMGKDVLRNIIEECMYFCLNFDLKAPPYNMVNYITVEQKNSLSYSSGMHTSKMVGFRMEKKEGDK